MELQGYIKELIFRHDCVIVPGFGGFVGNYRPAEVNYTTHTFSPPSKDIVFNAELKDNDGLLIGHISKISGMSYVDARKWLEKQVKELSRKLEKGKKVYLEDIGTFHLGKDKNILFEPARSVNFLTEAYGLSDFQLSPLEAYAPTAKERTKAVAGSGKTWKWIAVAVPLVAALTLIPLKTDWLDNLHPSLSGINPFHSREKSVTPPPKTEASASKNKEMVTGKITDEVTPAHVPEASVVAEEKSVEGTGEILPHSRYYIVAGSFRHPGNAETLKTQLMNQGVQPVIMEGPGGFIRVAYGGFEDKSQALQALRDARTKKGCENYWIVQE